MLKVAAIIPTRGDVDLGAIADRLRTYPEVESVQFVIGDTPFNRYRAMLKSDADYFLTQDDDCVTDFRPLFDAYEPLFVVNAMTPQHAAQYLGRQTLIGFGALLHRANLACFADYAWDRDALFMRESDRIFGTVNRFLTVFPDIQILPHASAPNRLWRQPDHVSARMEMNRRILETTGIVA